MSDTPDKQIFTLLQVTQSIKKTLSDRYKLPYWIKAEMNKLNLHKQSGHCYPALVEKKEGKVLAEIGAVIWKTEYKKINQKFISTINEPLKDGITILFQAYISYDPAFGLKLRIADIDPAYSLGEIEREKAMTIKKLKEEKIFDANKKLQIPLLPKRIAIISVDTSKGYSDFMNILNGNRWGYNYFTMLFPAILQGEKAIQTIQEQLQRIKKVKGYFDIVVIIRGGGADVGLSCYDNYDLCKAIAIYPIPVLTGIGHSTNETVSEMVSNRNSITPTDLADFLIQSFHNFAVPLQKAEETIINKTKQFVKDQKLKLLNSVKYFNSVILNTLIKNDAVLHSQTVSLMQQIGYFMQRQKDTVKSAITKIRTCTDSLITKENVSIANMERNIELLNPVNILKRGFSITYYGKDNAVTSASDVKAGDVLRTVFADGEVKSIVKK